METLPNEIIVCILEFLPNHSLQDFMKTSRSNCELCEIVWKRKYMNLVDGNPRIGFYKNLIGETKLVYYYRKYSHGLKKHFVDSQNEIMKKINQKGENVISYQERNKLVYETLIFM
jgi:hypothetical protein